jgi:dienelactone hydrolase
VDRHRIAIFGASVAVDYVVREAAANATQVKALILSTGWLTDKGRASLKLRKDLPVLVIASDDDPRKTQQESAEPFFLAEDRGSQLLFLADRGAAVFNRPGNPLERVTKWLVANLRAVGRATEITITTQDGVKLVGTLHLPDGIEKDGKVAGVVLVHGANHDATTWDHLAREVVKTGLGVLVFDQRGYRKSVSDPVRIPQSVDAVATRHLDIQAAVNFLASQSWIDSRRIGVVTATSRGGPAVRAIHGDARIRTLVGLSFYGADDETARFLSEMDIPLFMIASIRDENADGGSLDKGTREAYGLSKNKQSELLMFDGAGRGSSMLKTRPELTGMIVRWFAEKLAK